MQIKQFVPSHVCLKCDGCCHFQSDDSIWRPKWDKREAVDQDHFITTVKSCGRNLCRFFNESDHTCQVYDSRPFECALYPFVISREARGLELYVHLACPYVGQKERTPEFDEYMKYIKELFNTPLMKQYLKTNNHLWHDYSSASLELMHVMSIGET